MQINVHQFRDMMETRVKDWSDLDMVKVLIGIEESDLSAAFKETMESIVRTELTLRKFGKSKQKGA